MNTFCRTLAGVIGLGFVAGCNIPQFYATRDYEKTIPVNGPVDVIVETYNGYIDVTPCETQEVRLVAHIRASGENQQDAESRLDSLVPQIDSGTDALKITAENHANGVMNMDSVSMELKIPAKFPLSLSTSNGRVSTIGTRAPIQIKTSNGKIVVKNAMGKVDVHTSNGSVDIAESMGSVVAKSSNGAIKLQDCMLEEDTRLKTSNGRIEVEIGCVHNISVDANTSNGSIKCDSKNLEIANKSSTSLRGTIRSDSSNKTIQLELDTSNGSISIESRNRDIESTVSSADSKRSASE